MNPKHIQNKMTMLKYLQLPHWGGRDRRVWGSVDGHPTLISELQENAKFVSNNDNRA